MELPVANLALPLQGEVKSVVQTEGYVTVSPGDSLVDVVQYAQRQGRPFALIHEQGRQDTFLSVETVFYGIRKITRPDVPASGLMVQQLLDDDNLRESFDRDWELFRTPAARGHLHWCEIGRHVVSTRPCQEHPPG